MIYNDVYYEENKIQLTPYLEVPRFYFSQGKRILETCELRNLKFNDLQKGIILSVYEEYFAKLYPYFDREIILFIEFREYWKFLCHKYGVLDKSEIDKNFFSLDFLHSGSSLNVEIDSEEFHSGKHQIELARDQYLHDIFGIKTIRIYGTAISECKYSIDDWMAKNPNNQIRYIQFKQISGNTFEHVYQKELKELEKLFKLETFNRFFERKGIILTLKDLQIVKVDEGQLRSMRKFLQKYYNQQFTIIPDSIEYTTREAFNCLQDNTWDLEYSYTIPRWIIEFKGIPPKGLKIKYDKSNRSCGGKQFIYTLNKYKYGWEDLRA